MPKLSRLIEIALFLAASASALALLVSATLPAAPTVRVVPEPFVFDTPVLPASEHTINFVVHNESAEEIVLTGVSAFCGAQGCAKERSDLPQRIAPGGRENVWIVFKTPYAAGRFHYEVTLYTNAADRPELALAIEGTVSPE